MSGIEQKLLEFIRALRAHGVRRYEVRTDYGKGWSVELHPATSEDSGLVVEGYETPTLEQVQAEDAEMLLALGEVDDGPMV